MSEANQITVAIIGGTGLNTMSGVRVVEEHVVETEFGKPSSPVFELELEEVEGKPRFYFLPRHGKPHAVAPHLINYRANIAALESLGVKKILAVNAVGSIDPKLNPKDIVVPEQVIDYTHGREASFFDGTIKPLQHFDFSDPFDASLMETIKAVSEKAGCNAIFEGVYGVTQGPRLETAAEIKRMAQDGATLVGMTLMPEAVLAREVAIPYASICLIVNPAAGVSQAIITMEEIYQAVEEGMGQVQVLLKALVAELA